MVQEQSRSIYRKCQEGEDGCGRDRGGTEEDKGEVVEAEEETRRRRGRGRGYGLDVEDALWRRRRRRSRRNVRRDGHSGHCGHRRGRRRFGGCHLAVKLVWGAASSPQHTRGPHPGSQNAISRRQGAGTHAHKHRTPG